MTAQCEGRHQVASNRFLRCVLDVGHRGEHIGTVAHLEQDDRQIIWASGVTRVRGDPHSVTWLALERH